MTILPARMRLPALLLVLLTISIAGDAGQGTPKRKPDFPVPDQQVVQKAIDALNGHADRLMKMKGVVGSGVGLTVRGEVVINVYATDAGCPWIPPRLDGVPVRIVEQRGYFFPLAGPPARQRFEPRPVPIGVSAGVTPGQCGKGTLGARLRGPDGNVYALSTNHAFADENRSPTQSLIVQPAPGDSACAPNVTNDQIGRLKQFSEIVFSRTAGNRFDAAVISGTEADIGYQTPTDGYGAPQMLTVPPQLGQRVQKYGRTTGLTRGIVTAINVTALVEYREGVARFVEQFEVSEVPGAEPFAEPGDSGALVVDDGNSPVGLLFARGRRSALVNPIGPILSSFRMQIDGGSNPHPPSCDCTTQACATCSTEDLGYDLTVPEPVTAGPPDVRLVPDAQLPPRWTVNMKYVPPVGGPQEKVPNCFVWSSTYGLATFTAAKKGDYRPTAPWLQASPAYLFIDIMKNVDHLQSGCCTGGKIGDCLNLLKRTSNSAGGTPSMAQAPFFPNCCTLWNEYGSQNLTNDSRFSIGNYAAVSTKKSADPNLAAVKQILYSGRALCFGTHLYQDFSSYNGSTVPYVGQPPIATHVVDGHTVDVGHCMLIIGYDDTLGSPPNQGAFLIQNSFGPTWGQNGRVWWAYSTFSELSEGTAIYISEP